MGVTVTFETGRVREFREATSIAWDGKIVVKRNGAATHSFDPQTVVSATVTNEKGQPIWTITLCICGREIQNGEGEERPMRYLPGNGGQPGELYMRTICAACLPQYDRTHP
jgi:hypothetical protein